VSGSDRSITSTVASLSVSSGPATARGLSTGGDRAFPLSRLRVTRWSAYAWGAIAAVAVFVAITCWWLTQDRSIPIYDAGDHLNTAFEYHNLIAAGEPLAPLTRPSIYPILGGIVGALSVFIGGINVASPIIGENLVFVSLLALGVYQTGRLLFGRAAGMLAVVFVLGSPLLIAQFHVFMLDAPLTALVAVSLWLLLASEDFKRRDVSCLAGLTVGLGLNMKSQFPLFVAGLVVVMLAHGGWRNWRGLAIFCVPAAVIGAPWYIVHFSELGTLLELGGTNSGASAALTPSTFSIINLLWYFWNVTNSQLLGPLFVLAAGGTLWTVAAVARRPGERGRGERSLKIELLAGAFAAWLAITLTPHHDIRYGMPLLAFVAVVATGWITWLPRAPRLAALALLVIGVGANTLGINFGVGREIAVGFPSTVASTVGASSFVLYSTNGFLVSAPSRDGDVPGLLEELHREGVDTITWSISESEAPDFSFEGLLPLARIAQLSTEITQRSEFSSSPSVATLIHKSAGATGPAPCTRLSDGTGVWVVRYDTAARKLALYCPGRQPSFYDPGVVR
jgi:hypothetical protein